MTKGLSVHGNLMMAHFIASRPILKAPCQIESVPCGWGDRFCRNVGADNMKTRLTRDKRIKKPRGKRFRICGIIIWPQVESVSVETSPKAVRLGLCSANDSNLEADWMVIEGQL